MDEFSIIKKYFQDNATSSHTLLGIGDDAAIITPQKDKELCITTDTLIENRHFLKECSPYDIAYKSLAVNLSDLASMGATPQWVLLSLSIPDANEHWLSDFAKGFFVLCNEFDIDLIGGDLTKGPLSITIQAMGTVPVSKALRRDGAKVGDSIYISGALGGAALGLEKLKLQQDFDKYQEVISQHLRPKPRIELGKELIGFANSCIDISDGLLADIQHILKCSHVGAKLYLEKIPVNDLILKEKGDMQAYEFALTSGDDYQLCFTGPKDLAKRFDVFEIGEIVEGSELNLITANGDLWDYKSQAGFKHF